MIMMANNGLVTVVAYPPVKPLEGFVSSCLMTKSLIAIVHALAAFAKVIISLASPKTSVSIVMFGHFSSTCGLVIFGIAVELFIVACRCVTALD